MIIEIICNPNSGRGFSLYFARKLQAEFAIRGENNVTVFESLEISNTEKHFEELKEKNIILDALIILGGDGTFSTTVDRMLKASLNFPVAIFPLGTVNDFSKTLGMKKNAEKCAKIVIAGKKKKCDIALVNGDYAMNVAGGGYFTHGANTYSRTAKKIFGKLVYYVKGAFSAFGMQPQKLKITVDDEEQIQDIIMFLIMNSNRVGGFPKMGAKAKIDDGYFDLCAIKNNKNVFSMFWTFLKIGIGKHSTNRNIIYKKGKYFKVELAKNTKKDNPKFFHSDIDGNVGPALPIEVQVLKKEIELFANKR